MYSVVYDDNAEPYLKLESQSGMNVTMKLDKRSIDVLTVMLAAAKENIERMEKE